MTEYRITKEECEWQHVGKVCPRCGQPIGAFETTDNEKHPTYWSGCSSCMRFERGVEPRVFEIATIMYKDLNERPCLMDHSGSVEMQKRERMGELCRSIVLVEAATKILASRGDDAICA